MIITCVMSLPVSYTDKDGKPKTVLLRPGSHNYPMLDHKDPRVAEQLRVYRKHHRIGFDELLATDVEILKKIDPNLSEEEKAKDLIKQVMVKPPSKVKKNGSNRRQDKSAPAKSSESDKKENSGKGKG